MTLIKRTYRVFTRGPHASAVIVLIGLIGTAATVLALGVYFATFRYIAVAIAIGAVLLSVTVVAVLIDRLRATVNDVSYAISLDRSLKESGYAIDGFFTDGAAANPSLHLFQMKVLTFLRPRSVLELGSGQTTRVLTGYARDNPSASVVTLEQERSWFDRLRPQISHDYRSAPLEPVSFNTAGTGRHIQTEWYLTQPDLAQRKFDYILVDGPDHGSTSTAAVNYARSGILKHVPSILAASFVVVFDDADRYGVLMTVHEFQAILTRHSIRFVSFSLYGTKTQMVLCSADNAFLSSV